MKKNDNLPIVELASYRDVFNRRFNGDPESAELGLLRKAGLTQAMLCELAQVNRRMFSYYITGERYPTPGTVAKLAEGLGIPYSELKRQLVMSEERGIRRRLWVFGVESQTRQKAKLLQFQSDTALQRKQGVVGLASFNQHPRGIVETTQSYFVSRQSRLTPTELIDQEEWAPDGEESGFSIIERVDAVPPGIEEDDWAYFKEIAARQAWADYLAHRPKSYRYPSKKAQYVGALVENLIESLDPESRATVASAMADLQLAA